MRTLNICSPPPVKKINLNESLSMAGISPVNLHSMPKYQRGTAAAEKLSKVVDKFKSNILEVYPIDEVPAENSSVITKAQDMDRLLDNIKENLSMPRIKRKFNY